MSYSLNTPCYNCTKKETCTDQAKVQAAITNIHHTTKENGHQGSGTIVLACVLQNK